MGHPRFSALTVLTFALALGACGGNADGGAGGGSGGNAGADGGTAASGGTGAGGSGAGGSGGGSTVSCDAQDARSNGSLCALLLGYAWNGSGCETVNCGCTGSDCDDIYASEITCLNAHAGCGGTAIPCGDITCREGTQCCDPTCVPSCITPGKECLVHNCGDGGIGGGSGAELCGHRLCVGNEICCNSSCGACIGPGGGCTDEACPANCEAMDAVGVGPCDAEIGYVWDGDSCDSISGCDCSGQDCGWVYPTMAVCQQARSGCPGDL